jgi:hypothetical protein
MIATETGKIGIIKRARESVTPPRARYADVRRVSRGYLLAPQHDPQILAVARESFRQRADDATQSDYRRNDAEASLEVLDCLEKMRERLAGYTFAPAPQRQPTLSISGVAVSVNLDMLVHRDRGDRQFIGGAIFRFTQPGDDETDNAAAKRREMGLVAATLAHMQVRQNLAGNREPFYQLCLSVDVQCEEHHVAPRNYAAKVANIENACRFIAGMWDHV